MAKQEKNKETGKVIHLLFVCHPRNLLSGIQNTNLNMDSRLKHAGMTDCEGLVPVTQIKVCLRILGITVGKYLSVLDDLFPLS